MVLIWAISPPRAVWQQWSYQQGVQERAKAKYCHSLEDEGSRTNSTMQQSHTTHTSQWKAPASGLDAQGSPKHQKQLQPGMDTSDMYINLNKCMIPTHIPSWQPAVPFACCYRHSEINVAAWDSLLAIFITKHIHLAGGGKELSLWVNKILGQLAGNDREQISVGSLPWLWKPIMAGGQRSAA